MTRNISEENTQEIRDSSDRVLIFDTTLRDGEQSPGASMSLEEKLQIAETLDAMGVDVIEAGFPIASNGDFEAVQEVSKLVKNATVCGLSRAGAKDIDRAAEALKPAENMRIHTFISTSPVHMKHKLQMEPEAVLEAVAFSVDHARGYTDDVEWSAEDATRTDRDFLCQCIAQITMLNSASHVLDAIQLVFVFLQYREPLNLLTYYYFTTLLA